MSVPEPQSSQTSEIAHVLFMDIVAYSTLPMGQQQGLLEELNKAVRNTPEFARASTADQLIRLPTGDGMALVFFRDPEAPVRCAMQLSERLREHPEIKLRMGIHTGPVYRVADINANLNVAGGGINVAQRVMDCGDPGHTLVSKATADVLREVGGWADSLQDLGEVKVKHGLRLHLFELSKEEAGRQERRKRLRLIRARRMRRVLETTLLMVVIVGAASAWLTYSRKVHAPGRIDSIAVLPLENRSDNPDADYISDGVTESINNSLARLPGLKVIPPSLAYHYKGKAMDFQKIGEALGVQSILTGRVAERGDDLTIGVELDDVRNGTELWGQQYIRKMADLLAVQNDIAREVSQRLRSQLSAADQKNLTKGSTDNPEAYQLYLKGKYYTNRFTKEGFREGLDYFHQAIAIDPSYGLAYNGLAYNYINQVDWFLSPSEAGPNARDAANRALAIDESDADAHVSRAIVAHWYEWDWAAAEREFKRAIQLRPDDSEAHGYYSWFLAPMGRKDEAIAEAKRSQQLDPLSSLANFIVGSALVFTQQWDPAIEKLKSAKDLDPTYWFAPCFLGRAYEQKGRMPEAIAEFQRAVELEKYNPEIWSGLGHAYAVSGNRIKAKEVLNHLKELSADSYVAPFNFAVIYAGLGEKDQAFAWLNRAYADHSYYMAVYLTTDARLDSLRSDPRFADLRHRVGLPE